MYLVCSRALPGNRSSFPCYYWAAHRTSEKETSTLIVAVINSSTEEGETPHIELNEGRTQVGQYR